MPLACIVEEGSEKSLPPFLEQRLRPPAGEAGRGFSKLEITPASDGSVKLEIDRAAINGPVGRCAGSRRRARSRAGDAAGKRVRMQACEQSWVKRRPRAAR